MAPGKPHRESFYVTGGTLGPDAASYVERRCDQELFQWLLQGQFCYVLTSRQMGKSSLMVRTVQKLRKQRCAAVVWDLTAIGQNLNPEQWYDGLCVRVGQQLGVEEELEVFWKGHPELGPLQRLMVALEKVVMPGRERVVLFLDEIDIVRSLPFPTDEFFAAIRECYNRRAQDAAFERLTFCLLGVATPSDLIQDTRLTPFNIGQRIELTDFTAAEAAALAQGLRREGIGLERAQVLLSRILHWTNGHPYLTQRLCKDVAGRGDLARLSPAQAIDPLCNDRFFSHRARERDDNLLFVRERFLRSEVDRARLLQHYELVLRGRRIRDDESNPLVSALRLAGIVRSRRGQLEMRNRIYERVFDRAWVRDKMPDAEQRRVAAAYRKGVIRTTSIALVILAAMMVMVVIALEQRRRANRALRDSLIAQAASLVSQAQAQSVSGQGGQRFQSLQALRQAQPHYTDEAALRNQVIACLALVDLEEQSVSLDGSEQPTAVGLNRGLSHYAWADGQGAIHIIQCEGAGTTATIPSMGGSVAWLALSPDGRYLAAQYIGTNAPRFRLWEVPSARKIVELTNQVRFRAFDFAWDSTRAAVGVPSEGVFLYSLPGGGPPKVLRGQELTSIDRNPSCVRFAPAGDRLAEAAANSLDLNIWDLDTQQYEAFYHGALVVAMDWSPDGRQLAAATATRALYLWNCQRRRRRILEEAHPDSIVDLAFYPNGHVLASLGKDLTLRLWIPATGRQMIQSLPVEPSGRLFFSEDGQRLGLMTLQASTHFWQVCGSEEYKVFRPIEDVLAPITSIGFGSDGRRLFAGNNVGVFMWDTQTGQSLPVLNVKPVWSAVIDPVRGRLLISSPNEFIQVPKSLMSTSGQPNNELGELQRLALGDGLGRCALSASGNRGVVVRGNQLLVFHPDDPSGSKWVLGAGPYQELALSPDGRWLAAWRSQQNRIDLWSVVKTNAPTQPVKSLSGSGHFAFSPDGLHLVTCWERTYQFWKTGSWLLEDAHIQRPSFGNPIGPLAFAGNGTTGFTVMAVADAPATIKLYQIESGPTLNIRPRATLKSPDRIALTELVFNQDASRLAAATAHGTIEVWDLARIRKALEAMGLDPGLPIVSLSPTPVVFP